MGSLDTSMKEYSRGKPIMENKKKKKTRWEKKAHVLTRQGTDTRKNKKK